MTEDGTFRSGVFLAPFHAVDEDPTLLLRQDLELVEWLDRLGFEEAWIGEHHSGGFETIASPELFIAAAAEHTSRIRLGTGVVSLPYHNPLMVAQRIIQLDHMTRGRVMFGAGPGLLVSDAMMLGIDPNTQRDRMMQALAVILRLFRGEAVTERTDWYTLVEAQLHLLPYSRPHPEVCVASMVSPSGGRAAGLLDLGLLCVGATDPSGFDALGTNWQIARDIAAEHGRTMDPSRLRLVAPIHVAATREQARADVQHGLGKWIDYQSKLNPQRFTNLAGRDPVDALIESGFVVIGTPDDAVALIERLQAKQGWFGCFLNMATDWADWESTRRSYELYARHVVPQVRGANAHRTASLDWLRRESERFAGLRSEAVALMFAKHEADQRSKRGAG
ncbi:MAG TPA: LLM class flavin-dependent oxidoreductase [Acetobacteraceae bacterium]|jgi:limonene 1,2-monooxygenase|nr:LLM class flavin-dependent oxidoreductase [Acetobacteraceae bacterium]